MSMASGTMTSAGFYLGLVDDVSPKIRRITRTYKSSISTIIRMNDRLNASIERGAALMARSHSQGMQSGVQTGQQNQKNRGYKFSLTSMPGIGLFRRFFGDIQKRFRTQKFGAKLTPLATGGVTKGPLASLIGEHGKEAVLPLESSAGRKQLANALQDALKNALGTHGLSGASAIGKVTAGNIKGLPGPLLDQLKQIDQSFLYNVVQRSGVTKANVMKITESLTVAMKNSKQLSKNFDDMTRRNVEGRVRDLEDKKRENLQHIKSAGLDVLDRTHGVLSSKDASRQYARMSGSTFLGSTSNLRDMQLAGGRLGNDSMTTDELAQARSAVYNAGMGMGMRGSGMTDAALTAGAISTVSETDIGTSANAAYRTMSQLGIAADKTSDALYGMVQISRDHNIATEALISSVMDQADMMQGLGQKGNVAQKTLRNLSGAATFAADNFMRINFSDIFEELASNPEKMLGLQAIGYDIDKIFAGDFSEVLSKNAALFQNLRDATSNKDAVGMSAAMSNIQSQLGPIGELMNNKQIMQLAQSNGDLATANKQVSTTFDSAAGSAAKMSAEMMGMSTVPEKISRGVSNLSPNLATMSDWFDYIGGKSAVDFAIGIGKAAIAITGISLSLPALGTGFSGLMTGLAAGVNTLGAATANPAAWAGIGALAAIMGILTLSAMGLAWAFKEVCEGLSAAVPFVNSMFQGFNATLTNVFDNISKVSAVEMIAAGGGLVALGTGLVGFAGSVAVAGGILGSADLMSKIGGFFGVGSGGGVMEQITKAVTDLATAQLPKEVKLPVVQVAELTKVMLESSGLGARQEEIVRLLTRIATACEDGGSNHSSIMDRLAKGT